MSAYAILDIETTTDAAWLARRATEAKPADVGAWVLEHAGDGTFNPVAARIICWSVIAPDGTEHCEVGEEADILPKLDALLADLERVELLAHNGADYDYPMIRARALANNLPRLARRVWQNKPWDPVASDTASPAWFPRPPHTKKGWGYSLDTACELLGIERRPTLPGSEVPRAWYQGRWNEIREHNLDDVRTLAAVAERLAQGRAA